MENSTASDTDALVPRPSNPKHIRGLLADCVRIDALTYFVEPLPRTAEYRDMVANRRRIERLRSALTAVGSRN